MPLPQTEAPGRLQSELMSRGLRSSMRTPSTPHLKMGALAALRSMFGGNTPLRPNRTVAPLAAHSMNFPTCWSRRIVPAPQRRLRSEGGVRSQQISTALHAASRSKMSCFRPNGD